MIGNPTTGTIAAGGLGAMLAGVIIWLLGLFHISVPPDVALDIGFLIVSAFAFVVHRLPPERSAAVEKALADAIELARKE